MKKILTFVMILILTAGAVGCGSEGHAVSSDTTAGLTAKEETSPSGMDASMPGSEAESTEIAETAETAETTFAAKTNETTATAVTKRDSSTEFRIYGKRSDGLPENYPDQLVPIYQLKEIMNSAGNSWGCAFEYVTAASYDDAAAYYRELLRDKEDFEEEELSDETFHCKTPDWDINVNVIVHFSTVKVMIELYSLTWEDNPYLE